MAALTDREAARERLSHAFHTMLDRMVPPDAATPLPGGGQFVDWEDQGERMARTLVPMFLEERAALDGAARAAAGGVRCPGCASDRVYLADGAVRVEVVTPLGPVVVDEQRCRCRSCDRSFSPPAVGLGAAGRGPALAQGGGPGGP